MSWVPVQEEGSAGSVAFVGTVSDEEYRTGLPVPALLA